MTLYHPEGDSHRRHGEKHAPANMDFLPIALPGVLKNICPVVARDVLQLKADFTEQQHQADNLQQATDTDQRGTLSGMERGTGKITGYQPGDRALQQRPPQSALNRCQHGVKPGVKHRAEDIERHHIARQAAKPGRYRDAHRRCQQQQQ